MVRRLFLSFLLINLLFAGVAFGVITEKQVVDLVQQTCSDMAGNANKTIQGINDGRHPYKNKDDNTLYVYVFDTDLNIIAHYKSSLVGENHRGKPDAGGKLFRDEILEGALKNGEGWVEYVYEKPGEEGIFNKKAYYRLIKGSDGKRYIVASGLYLN